MQKWEYLKTFISTAFFEGGEVVTQADSTIYGKKGKYLESSANCPDFIKLLE